jgi:Siphovirus ReqiPepy6 Gp37-like protein
MEPYTLNRSFIKQQVVDNFDSIIWTERYYGDSEIEIVVPATQEMFRKLPLGAFIGLDMSDEIMILESFTIDKGKYKLSGISLLPWLDNRFVRTSAKHDDEHWYIENKVPGEILWIIVYNMCCQGSPYLSGSIPIGISNPQRFIIPGLGLRDYDKSGIPVKVGVPYGPVYKALKEIATSYKIGMQITLDDVTDTSYSLGFRSYKGIDRTSAQTENPVIRFSPQMDSFTDIKDLQSIAALKTVVYTFAPGLKPDEGSPDLRTTPGVSELSGPDYVGFDLRALQEFEGDISTDQVGGSPQNLVDILNSRAFDKLIDNQFVKSVDGEIVPDSQFKYGIHYNLGDLIEVEGNTGVIQTARITEHIRSQDSAGEKSYPTVSITD